MKLRIISFVGLVLFASCSDELQIQPRPESDALNVLKFSSQEEFKNITSNISKLSPTELDAWELGNSFKSYRKTFAEANKEWEELESLDKQEEFLQKYGDILRIEDGALIPLLTVTMYQAIANRQGIYQTEGNLNKIIGNFIATVKVEDYKKLDLIKLTDGQLNEVDGVHVTQYITENRDINSRTNATSLGTLLNAEYYYNPSGCNNDRKAFLTFQFYLYYYAGTGIYEGYSHSGIYYQTAVEVKVRATRRNSLCNWNDYSNPLQWRSVHITGKGFHFLYEAIGEPLLQQRNVYEILTYDTYINDHSSEIDVIYAFTNVYFGELAFQPDDNYIPSWSSPEYTYAYGEGKSQGIGDNWAVILDY